MDWFQGTLRGDNCKVKISHYDVPQTVMEKKINLEMWLEKLFRCMMIVLFKRLHIESPCSAVPHNPSHFTMCYQCIVQSLRCKLSFNMLTELQWATLIL